MIHPLLPRFFNGKKFQREKEVQDCWAGGDVCVGGWVSTLGTEGVWSKGHPGSRRGGVPFLWTCLDMDGGGEDEGEDCCSWSWWRNNDPSNLTEDTSFYSSMCKTVVQVKLKQKNKKEKRWSAVMTDSKISYVDFPFVLVTDISQVIYKWFLINSLPLSLLLLSKWVRERI